MPRAALADALPEPLDPTASERARVGQPGRSGIEADAADRRAHRRYTLAELPSVAKVRIKYGPLVTLVDLSTGGAQIQTDNFRLQPRSTVVLEISGSHGELAVTASVLRCQLARLLPEPLYRGALVFTRDIDLVALGAADPAMTDAVAATEDEPPLDPGAELAQLKQVVARLAIVATGDESPAASRMLAALDAAHATLSTAAGKRAGGALAEEVADLFNAMAMALERRPTPAALVGAIEGHLVNVVPARTISVVDPTSVVQLGAEAIFLSVPLLSDGGVKRRLAVEFAHGCEPQELHFQILKASVHLVAVADELGRVNGADNPLSIRDAEPLPDGWSRVVIRYNNQRMHKGFVYEFAPVRGYIQVSAEPVLSPNNKVMVPFTDLKAVFFVKDHDGLPGYQERTHLAPDRQGPAASPRLGSGRKVRVTFKDGETLVGTTTSSASTPPGFFVKPADPRSNNDRVFVIAQSVSRVQFL